MRSGTVAAISAGDHSLSQAWSRYFWEHPDIYGELDGLLSVGAQRRARGRSVRAQPRRDRGAAGA
jgi:hypothetical protein